MLEVTMHSYQAKNQCINKIVHISKKQKWYSIILSLPGTGSNTALRLLVKVGTITRFMNNKQSSANASMDISRFQSIKTFYKDKLIKIYERYIS